LEAEPNSVDRQKFVLVVSVVVLLSEIARIVLEIAAGFLEVAGLGVSLLVFSYFFLAVEKVDFPLG
jgi:hypothetical protein